MLLIATKLAAAAAVSSAVVELIAALAGVGVAIIAVVLHTGSPLCLRRLYYMESALVCPFAKPS